MADAKTIIETSAAHDDGMVYRIPCPIDNCCYVLNVCLSNDKPATNRHQHVAVEQQYLRISHPNHGES